MIRLTRRESYFGLEETHWQTLNSLPPYKEIRFILWVFEIDGEIYTRGSPKFKENYEKARVWIQLQQ